MPRILHFHKDKPIIHSACFYIAAMNDTEERESSAQLAREITGQCQPDLAFRFACVRTDKQRLYLYCICDISTGLVRQLDEMQVLYCQACGLFFAGNTNICEL